MRAEMRGARAKFTSALNLTRATFPHEHISKAHAGRASSLPKEKEPFSHLTGISPRRPRRGSRLPAEKLRCARSQLCLQHQQKYTLASSARQSEGARALPIRSCRITHRRSFAIIAPGSGLDQTSAVAPRRDDRRHLFPLLCTVRHQLQDQETYIEQTTRDGPRAVSLVELTVPTATGLTSNALQIQKGGLRCSRQVSRGRISSPEPLADAGCLWR